jgi:hypothetical protein
MTTCAVSIEHQPCPCESRYTIYCPTCDRRCRLELTHVPTFDARATR